MGSYCCRSASENDAFTQDNNPDSAYLHFGGVPRSWDAKVLSSRIEKAGIEIMRARVDCKSAGTQGLHPTKHMHIFANRRLLNNLAFSEHFLTCFIVVYYRYLTRCIFYHYYKGLADSKYKKKTQQSMKRTTNNKSNKEFAFFR